MPRVTVLLPVRDSLPTLADCLRSLTAQTLEDHEVVAVDDGSRDGSAELLEAYARTDPRLRGVRTEARGLVPARNAALGEARAPLVARRAPRDLAHRTTLARPAQARGPG